MTRPDPRRNLREGLIAAAFFVVVAVGVWTVLIPELRDEPGAADDPDTALDSADAGV